MPGRKECKVGGPVRDGGAVNILALHKGRAVSQDGIVRENMARFVARAGVLGVRSRLNGMRKITGMPPELVSIVADYADAPLPHWDCWRQLAPREVQRWGGRLEYASDISHDRRGLLIAPGRLQCAFADRTIGELSGTWSVRLTFPTRGGNAFFYVGLMLQPVNRVPSFGVIGSTKHNNMAITCSDLNGLREIESGVRSLRRNVCICFSLDIPNRRLLISSEQWRHEGGDAFIQNVFSIPHLPDYRPFAVAGVEASVLSPMKISFEQ